MTEIASVTQASPKKVVKDGMTHTFFVTVKTMASQRKCAEQIVDGLSHVKEGIETINVFTGGEFEPSAVKSLLRHSWEDIDFSYEGLTAAEQSKVSREEFESLVKWVKS